MAGEWGGCRVARAVALITGASSGIGEVFARKLAAEYDLILVARRRDRLEALAEELRAKSGTAVEVMEADLSEESGMSAVAERLRAEERLELLVNNAGFGSRGYFWEAELAGQEAMHRLHVMATVRLCHAALKGMVARDHGGIINVASVAGFVRRAGSASYGATKSWMIALTEALSLELEEAGSRVRVQALCPGFTYSEFHDVLQIDRGQTAAKGMWLTADEVVGDSLAGLKAGKLYVIPGWKYRMIVAVVTKLPVRVRLMIERSNNKRRR